MLQIYVFKKFFLKCLLMSYQVNNVILLFKAILVKFIQQLSIMLPRYVNLFYVFIVGIFILPLVLFTLPHTRTFIFIFMFDFFSNVLFIVFNNSFVLFPLSMTIVKLSEKHSISIFLKYNILTFYSQISFLSYNIYNLLAIYNIEYNRRKHAPSSNFFFLI